MLHRGTPLYGQPAWWGDGDTDGQQPGRPEEKSSDRKREKAETGSVYNAAKITNLCGLMMYVEAVINVDHIAVYELYLYILDIKSFKYVQS